MIRLQIPDYQIVRELGSGAMGTVYEAVHTKLARRVAIKVVRPEFARDPELETRFVNEARALARVRHPSIVLIFEFGILPDGTAYLVMEFLHGESLETRMQKRQLTDAILPELQLIEQLARALALLHSHGVVHRDLKPANVMVISEPGQTPPQRAKLVDFGLAKLIRLSGSKTASSLIMGTPAYMSPEQCRGAGQVGAKTDCYALGVMLYELVAGRLPFEALGAGEMIGMHLHVEPPPLDQFAPGVDPRLVTLVNALLRKDQAHRPAIADVAAYLLALIEQINQKVPGRLPHLDPKVDPLEDTYLSSDVARNAPAAPPSVPALAPGRSTPPLAASQLAARKSIISPQIPFLPLLIFIFAVGVLLIFGSFFYINNRDDEQSLKDNKSDQLIHPTPQNLDQYILSQPRPTKAPEIDSSPRDAGVFINNDGSTRPDLIFNKIENSEYTFQSKI